MALINCSPLDMELGVQRQDIDAYYLRQLSVYATVRDRDLKTTGHRSLSDILSGWKEEKQTTDITEEVAEVDLSECRDYELKVQGFDVDSRIAPGFRYHVRYIGTNEYLFDGEARRLESIGLGYGRRLTFKGDTLNFNDCYFWTDSNPEGFAFTIEAVKEGDEFTIIDSDRQQVATAIVDRTDFPQVELDTEIKGSNVVKNVKVRFSCYIKHNNNNGGLMINVNAQDFEMVEGIAQIVKERGSKEAVVRCIKNVYFPSFGKCNLHNDK